MAQNEIKYPAGNYKIVNVGPSREWDFTGTDGDKIKMVSYSLQFENVAEWVDLAQKPDTPAPEVGQELEGHIEDSGKYGLKFVKVKKGGFGGSRGFSVGAQYANAVQTATTIVTGYYQVTGTKPKDINEMISRIEELSTSVKNMVDKLAGSEKKDSNTETAAKDDSNNKAVIDDIDEKELKW